MDGQFLGGSKNRYELICDEELDPFEVLEKAELLKKMNLKGGECKKDSIKVNVKASNTLVETTKEGVTEILSGASDDKDEISCYPTGPPTDSWEEGNEDENRRSGSADSALQGEPWIECVKGKSRRKRRGGMPRPAGLERSAVPPRDGSGLGAVPRRYGLELSAASRRDGIQRGAVPRRDWFNERGKREFDRQSGCAKSGVKPVEKRDGGGARNWGRPSDNLEAARGVSTDESTTDETQSDTSEPKVGSDRGRGDAEPKITLAEWKQREKGSRSIPEYKLRKPGEGEDTTQWENLYMLKKKSPKEPTERPTKGAHIQRSRQQQETKIDVVFSDEGVKHKRSRPVAGARRLGSRTAAEVLSSPQQEEQDQKLAPKFDDLLDFPSLSDRT